jgi:Kef-type K+ transport system membrane component KefB
VTGIAQGFFVPLFFVVLGARIDVRAFVEHASLVELAALLIAFNVVIHIVGAAVSRQPLSAGLAAAAQLGVPTAVVALGLQARLLSAGTGAAIMVAALASIGICTVGVVLLSRRAEPAVGVGTASASS